MYKKWEIHYSSIIGSYTNVMLHATESAAITCPMAGMHLFRSKANNQMDGEFREIVLFASLVLMLTQSTFIIQSAFTQTTKQAQPEFKGGYESWAPSLAAKIMVQVALFYLFSEMFINNKAGIPFRNNIWPNK